MELPKSCRECEYKQYDKSIDYWICGLMSNHAVSLGIDKNGEPYDYIPLCCKLRERIKYDKRQRAGRKKKVD